MKYDAEKLYSQLLKVLEWELKLANESVSTDSFYEDGYIKGITKSIRTLKHLHERFQQVEGKDITLMSLRGDN